jgi:hypothetical protein
MKKLLIGLIALSMVLSLAIGNASGNGTTGAQFLRIGVGARACAMGEAYAAIADDPTAIFWNPAGIAQLERKEIVFDQNFWLLDITHQYLAFTSPMAKGNIGASFYYSSSGDIPKTENFITVGKYSAYDAAASIAYAGSLKKSIFYGAAVKYIFEKIENESAQTFAGDLGVIFKPVKLPGLKGALEIRNIGPGVKFIENADPLPLYIGLAGSYVYRDFTCGLAIGKHRGNDLSLGLGAEYLIKNTLALRAGYNTAHSITMGMGIYWKVFKIDYAMAPNKDLDSSHRVTLGIVFR